MQRSLVLFMLLLIPCAAFGSIIGDVSALADTWFRMTNFNLLTAISLWTGSMAMIAKIRMWGTLNPALARSLAFTNYSINFVCLCLVALHFSPEMEAIFDFIINIFSRLIG